MGLDAFCVVLVAPLYAGNVGAVCRAMANMGVSDLRLVAPRVDDWTDAERMACHARPLLEARQVCDSLAEAVGDCVAAVGTTVRGGLYRQHVRSPREWAPELIQRSTDGKVALVFGREDHGLSNDEIAICTHLVRIPTDAAYPSLNLAQAALICLYELFLVGGDFVPTMEKSDAARLDRRERMTAMWRELLLNAGFMDNENADHMMQGIRRIFTRGAWSIDDVNILMGVARQCAWAQAQARSGSGDL